MKEGVSELGKVGSKNEIINDRRTEGKKEMMNDGKKNEWMKEARKEGRKPATAGLTHIQ